MGNKRKATEDLIQPSKKIRTDNKKQSAKSADNNKVPHAEKKLNNSEVKNSFLKNGKSNVTNGKKKSSKSASQSNEKLVLPKSENVKIKDASSKITKKSVVVAKASASEESADNGSQQGLGTLPVKPSEVSCNWKRLLESGKVKHNDKKSSSKKSLPDSEKKANSNNCGTEQSNEIWFDGVDKILLETEGVGKEQSELADTASNCLVKPNSFAGLTKAVAIDCEMVGIGPNGDDDMLARVSLVNHFGSCLYDKHVKPVEKVVDYRTFVSGIRPSDLENAEDFKTVQKEVNDIISGRILVGHALHNDLKVLYLTHPHKMIRDTSRYKKFRAVVKGGTPSLKKLSEALLGVKIQQGEHSSVQDAQAAMRLYTMFRKEWEAMLKLKKKK